ncbi:MAG: PAS domain-containing protein [Alphaproteobacteria bacterium]|nr:PAS domain-containing protein [Alphaproteobacteria bacterium]
MSPSYLVKQLYPEHTRFEEISCYDLLEPNVCVGVSHWTQLRGSRPYPARDELDIRQLGRALESISLVRVIDDGADFLIRVAGDQLRRAYAAQLSGRLLSDLETELPISARRWRKMFRKVVASGRPVAIRITVGCDAPELNFFKAEGVCLPFGDPGRVDYLVVFASHALVSVEEGQVV